MRSKIQSIRGMDDIYSDKSRKFRYLYNTCQNILDRYCFEYIQTPILEKYELFHRGLGDSSDVISKETYDFADKSGDMVTMRPEGTAGCVRAVIQNSMSNLQKLWYWGPMFRYERPQKGRYRQFHQLGVEIYGSDNIAADIELQLIIKTLLDDLNLSQYTRLEINCLGSHEERSNYQKSLVVYFKDNFDLLDDDSKVRLDKNPLRILDSKNPSMKNLISAAPNIYDYLTSDTKERFSYYQDTLNKMGISYIINSNLVRGLDYYTGIVFEWVTDSLGSQSAVCAGGRYDNLVEQLGGKNTPAVGFAIGIERFMLLMELEDDLDLSSPDIFIIYNGNGTQQKSLDLAYVLRGDFKVNLLFDTSSFKSQFKKADKAGARLAIVIGESELQNNKVIIKFLQEDKEQVCLSEDHCLDYIKEYFNSANISS